MNLKPKYHLDDVLSVEETSHLQSQPLPGAGGAGRRALLRQEDTEERQLGLLDERRDHDPKNPEKLRRDHGWGPCCSPWLSTGSSPPNQVAMGGVTGLAQVINVLVPALPVGVLTILLNVPLFLAGWKLIGFHLLASSLFSMAVSSVAIDVIAAWYLFRPWTPCWHACAAEP